MSVAIDASSVTSSPAVYLATALVRWRARGEWARPSRAAVAVVAARWCCGAVVLVRLVVLRCGVAAARCAMRVRPGC